MAKKERLAHFFPHARSVSYRRTSEAKSCSGQRVDNKKVNTRIYQPKNRTAVEKQIHPVLTWSCTPKIIILTGLMSEVLWKQKKTQNIHITVTWHVSTTSWMRAEEIARAQINQPLNFLICLSNVHSRQPEHVYVAKPHTGLAHSFVLTLCVEAEGRSCFFLSFFLLPKVFRWVSK